MEMKENTHVSPKISRQTKMDTGAMHTRSVELERRYTDLGNLVQALTIARVEELEAKVVIFSE